MDKQRKEIAIVIIGSVLVFSIVKAVLDARSRKYANPSTSSFPTSEMGNCCGRQSSDNFSTPGRTLGSAPAPQSKSSSTPLPKKISSNPGKSLGGSSSTGDGSEDPREAAARAAEVRSSRCQLPIQIRRVGLTMVTIGKSVSSERAEGEIRAESTRSEEADESGHTAAIVRGAAPGARPSGQRRGKELELKTGGTLYDIHDV